MDQKQRILIAVVILVVNSGVVLAFAQALLGYAFFWALGCLLGMLTLQALDKASLFAYVAKKR